MCVFCFRNVFFDVELDMKNRGFCLYVLFVERLFVYVCVFYLRFRLFCFGIGVFVVWLSFICFACLIL